jgi:hypothetical protein
LPEADSDSQIASEVPYNNELSELSATNVQQAIDELDFNIDTAIGDIGDIEGRLDTIEGDDQTAGSIAKALADAKDYTDNEVITEAVGIGFNNELSELIATNTQDAIDEVTGRVDGAEDRLDTLEGDVSTEGSVLKAIDDAIGVTVQAFDADTVVDASYNNFNPSGTYDNLRAKATTAEDVGLGSVTNESKATMFTDPTFTGVVTLSGETKKLTGLPLPDDATDAASKSYVDNVAQGLKARTSALVLVDFDLDATYDDQPALHELTANNNEAFPTVDGINSTVLNVVGARLLVAGQTNPEENGLYVVKTAGVDGVSPWVIRRCTECDTSEKIPGSYIFVTKGTIYENTGWILDVDNPLTFTLGTDAITVIQFSGVGTFTAGDGLDLTGNEFSVDSTVLRAVEGYADADSIIAELLTKADKLVTTDTKSGSFTLALTDADKVLLMTNTSAATLTIPTNASVAFPIGTQIGILRNGTGTVTFGGSGVTILSDASKKSIKAQYTAAALLKTGTDTWQLVGNLAT